MERDGPSRTIRARAPTRICLIGGGTDVDPFAALHQGAIVNVAIDRRHYVIVHPRADRRLIVNALGEVRELDLDHPFGYGEDPRFDLVRAIVDHFRPQLPGGLAVTVRSDVPDACGLGTSGSVAVALIGALSAYVAQPLSRAAIARLAFEIETVRLGWAGGKQDQWAAAHGGLCLTTFGPLQQVEVQPLQCSRQQLQQLRQWLLLVHAGGRRRSAELQQELQSGMRDRETTERRAALEELKSLAIQSRALIEGGQWHAFGELAHRGWEAKQRSNPTVSSPRLAAIYGAARDAGALGGKVVGAGGAGYIYLICPPSARAAVVAATGRWAAPALEFEFDHDGLVVETSPAEAR